MIIDFHTHIFPDGLARRATGALEKSGCVKSEGTATKDAILRAMDECGVDASVVLNVATNESQHENILRFAKSIDSKRLISFGSVMQGSVHALEYIWKTSDEGLRGLKFHPALQRARPSDKRFFPLYDLARALNLIVTFHAGWDFSYPDEILATPEALLEVVKNFPGLRVVAAHMGGIKCSESVLSLLAERKDIYFDTAYCASKWISKEMMERIIRKHGAERILFGSDYPWHRPSREMDLIRSLDISDEDKALILGGNAERLLNL